MGLAFRENLSASGYSRNAVSTGRTAVSFTPHLAERRFGVGLSPRRRAPRSIDDMLARLSGRDAIARDHPIPDTQAIRPSFAELIALQQARGGGDGAEARYQDGRRRMDAARREAFLAHLARGVETEDGFRERLTQFWADHFTVRAKRGLMRHYVTPYVEETIRPHVAGRFADMLKAAVKHPVMLLYLDQETSVGPNSPAARDRRGLNENLAREVLELHTLGVDAPYSQRDVRQLAELFTGLSFGRVRGFWFRPQFAEPGAEEVLGRSYGPEPSVAEIDRVLDDLARHPATARHLARKLAVHFIADDPPPGAVAAMAAAYTATDGNLMAVYEAMLRHPAAWRTPPERAKVMPPFAFMQAALRGLGVPGRTLARLDRPTVQRHFWQPMRQMGQDWERPPGPDGLSEAADAWITPQGMATRIEWAFSVPDVLMRRLPDPRRAVYDLLGEAATSPVVFAAGAAESREEGIGLILTSPAFQRRA